MNQEQRPRLEWIGVEDRCPFAVVAGLRLMVVADDFEWQVHPGDKAWTKADSLLSAQLAAEKRARELLRKGLEMLGEEQEKR